MDFITSNNESLIYKDLIYNIKFQVIIYTTCKSAIGSLESIIKHLIQLHLDIYTKEEINSIIKDKLKELTIENPNNIKTPTPYKYYFNYLKSYQGTICLQCDFITINIKAIK